MTHQASVRAFLDHSPWAVVGVSASGKRYGAAAYRALKKNGYRLIPVHPAATTIEGDPAYPTLAEIPEEVGGVLIVVPPERALEVLQDAAAAGVTRAFLQQGAESDEAARFCAEHNIDLVAGECILMLADRTGLPHRCHRWVWGVLGKLPTEATP